MSSFSKQQDDFLGELDAYLEWGPSGEDRLGEVVERLDDNDVAEKTLQLLATAVGQEHEWQSQYLDSGILNHVVQNLDLSKIPTALAKQHLRVIGNCVADNDAIRAVVTNDLDKLIACLSVEELTTTALVVIYNLGNDFDPAHCEAAKLRLDNTIAEYLVTGTIPEEAAEYATELLTWITEKLTPAQLQDDTSIKVFSNILEFSSQSDEEGYEEYIAILVYYLQDQEFQQKVANPDTVERLIDLLYDFESRLSPEETQSVFQELNKHADPKKVAPEDENVTLMLRLINSISAISASDAFVRTFDLQSPVVKKVRSKLASPTISPSTVCACVILGNLATSDKACIDMVENLELHLPLINLLALRKEQAILYAAAGFMRHLTFPEANRLVLGQAGLIETCSHLLTNKDSSVRGEAAAILCKLVSNNFPNIERVVNGTIPDSVTLAQIAGIEAPAHPTMMYHIVTQALAPSAPLLSTSMKNPMIEIGRTIIAMLRFLRRSDAKEDANTAVRHMFMTPAIARPVARLVRQRFYADARSEGLLGLGLMAQSDDGAVCVVEEMKADEGLLEAIKEFAVEQKGGQESNASAGRDYQNAVVLLHGLAKNGVTAMDSSLKSDVESLQAELNRLMVS